MGRRVFGGSLQSAAVLLVCKAAGRKVEHAVRFFTLKLQPFNFPEARGGGWSLGGSLQSSWALLECMPARREVERTERFVYLAL